MPARYRVALQGFSEFERNALTFCLRLTSERATAYEPVLHLSETDFVIADADLPGVIDNVVQAGRTPNTVFVGRQAPEDALSHVPRPIDPTQIVRELDQLLALHGAAAPTLTADVTLPPIVTELSEFPQLDDDGADAATVPGMLGGIEPEERTVPTPLDPPSFHSFTLFPHGDSAPAPFPPPFPPPFSPPFPPHVKRPAGGAEPRSSSEAPTLPGLESARPAGLPPLPRPEPLPADPAPAEDERAAAKAAARRAARHARQRQASSEPATEQSPHVLVLDDSEIAQVFLCRLLTDFGFLPHAVASSEEALGLLAEHAFSAVFLDVQLDPTDELDGIDICHRIKHESAAAAQANPPAVIVVSGQARPADKVRAGLAGSDGFLPKPLSRGAVARVLESCGIALPSDARRG